MSKNPKFFFLKDLYTGGDDNVESVKNNESTPQFGLDMPNPRPTFTIIEDAFLSLEIAEERGDWEFIEWRLKSEQFSWIRQSGDGDVFAWLVNWHTKLSQAKEYEATHGKGCLYKKDHPDNIRIEKLKKQWKKQWGERAVKTYNSMILCYHLSKIDRLRSIKKSSAS